MGVDLLIKEGIHPTDSSNKALQFKNAALYRMTALEGAIADMGTAKERFVKFIDKLDGKIVDLLSPRTLSMVPWKEEVELISDFKHLINKEYVAPDYFNYSSLKQLMSYDRSIQSTNELLLEKNKFIKDLWDAEETQETIFMYNSDPDENALQKILKKFDEYREKQAELSDASPIDVDIP